MTIKQVVSILQKMSVNLTKKVSILQNLLVFCGFFLKKRISFQILIFRLRYFAGLYPVCFSKVRRNVESELKPDFSPT